MGREGQMKNAVERHGWTLETHWTLAHEEHDMPREPRFRRHFIGPLYRQSLGVTRDGTLHRQRRRYP